MINVEAIDQARRKFAAAGSALVEEMSVYLPALWPPHEYDPIASPTGVFQQSAVDYSAPNFPGYDVTLPNWVDLGTAEGFAEGEGDKVTLFQSWLFTRRDVEFLEDYFAFEPFGIFYPFGTRADRQFEDGRFPRDVWKPGSFDADLWNASRRAIASAALRIIEEIDTLNTENIQLAPRDWIQTKIVQGPVVGLTGQVDSTFTNMPELLEDVSGDWHDLPAFLRVAEFFDDGDPTWSASGGAFAWAANRYDQLFARLTSAAFAQDYFDQCFTLWRTGSQTHRRDANL